MTGKNRKPLVSIIMPVYNADEFIEKSVSCILRQSYENIELIAVNDGSKDDTGEKLDSLAAGDARLRVLSVPNGGPAEARNRGLEIISSESEYIMFADSDDELAPDAVEYALNGAADGSDMVIFGFSIVDARGDEKDYCEAEQKLDREGFAAAFARLYKANLLNQVWGKLYRTSLNRDNDIRFPDYRWGEDRLFIFDCLEKADSICVLPQCRYRYIMHEGESLISRYYDKKFDVCCLIDSRVEELCGELGITDQADFRYMFAKSVFSCLTNMYSPSCGLSGAEKKNTAKKIITNERVKRRCRSASGGFPTAFLCAVMRSGLAGLNLAAFHFVAFVGEKAPVLFIKLKHKK